MNELPDILLITTDQHRADCLGCAGNPAAVTPNLDRLAARGIRYANAVCQAPVCTPNRACWLTGQYLDTHGVWANGVSLPDSPDLLPRMLQSAGYQTAMIGKLHVTPLMSPNQPADGDFGFDRVRLTEGDQPGGYRHWLVRHAPREADKLHHHFPPRRLGDVYEPHECLPEELHSTRWVGEQARAAWRQRVQLRPMFMHVSFPDPHHPFEAPQRWVDAICERDIPSRVEPPEDWSALPTHFGEYYAGRDPLGPQKLSEIDEGTTQRTRRYYLASIAFIDAEIGRLMEDLEPSDRPRLVIFTSDHGELLGDHGLWYKGLYHYDALLKTPLIVCGHGAGGAATVVEAPVEAIDLAPTILAICRLNPPREFQGTVLPGLAGRSAQNQPREFTLTQQRAPWYTPEMRAATIRSLHRKLTLYEPTGDGELYDLESDPEETVNLWEDPRYASERDMLLQRMVERMMSAAGPGHRRTYRA